MAFIVKGYGYQFTPLAQAVESSEKLTRTLRQVAIGDKELSELAEPAVNAFGYLVGLPTKQLTITGGYLQDLANGRAHPDNIFQFFHDLVYQRPKEERD
jgi:hypothetical protein